MAQEHSQRPSTLTTLLRGGARSGRRDGRSSASRAPLGARRGMRTAQVIITPGRKPGARSAWAQGPSCSCSAWRERRYPVRGQSWIVASMAKRRDWLTFSHLAPFPLGNASVHDPWVSMTTAGLLGVCRVLWTIASVKEEVILHTAGRQSG